MKEVMLFQISKAFLLEGCSNFADNKNLFSTNFNIIIIEKNFVKIVFSLHCGSHLNDTVKVFFRKHIRIELYKNYLRVKDPCLDENLEAGQNLVKIFKKHQSEAKLVPQQHLRWSSLWQLTALVNVNWNHCQAIVRKSPILDNAWILDLRLPIKKFIFNKIRIRGSHLDLQKHLLMVASWKLFIKNSFRSSR